MTKSAQVIEVVTVSLRGDGSPGNPFREVTQYWSPLGGEPLATVDPLAPAPRRDDGDTILELR